MMNSESKTIQSVKMVVVVIADTNKMKLMTQKIISTKIRSNSNLIILVNKSILVRMMK